MTKHMRLLTFLTIILFLTFFSPLFAQDADNALWTTIDIKKKFKHGLALNFEEEYRIRNNFSFTDKFQTTLDFSWKPLSFLKGGIAYCMINKTKSDSTWELRHRYIAYIVGSYDIGRFSLSLKEKIQQTYRVGVVADSSKSNPITVIRSKFEVSYNIKGVPLTPFASIEIFYSLNEPDGKQDPPTTKMISEMRYAAGLEYSLMKNLDISAGYLCSSGNGWDNDIRDLSRHKVGGYAKSYTNALMLGLSYTF